MFGRRRALPRLSATERADLLRVLNTQPNGLEQTVFDVTKCQHCGGVHSRACPRVKAMTYHPGGSLASVEYWETYDQTHVIWPEDLYDTDVDDESEEPE